MNKPKTIEEKFKEEVQKELGVVSGIFMSQGNTRAGDIVMPTEELLEVADRIELYFFSALKDHEKQVREEIAEKIMDLPTLYGMPEANIIRSEVLEIINPNTR